MDCILLKNILHDILEKIDLLYIDNDAINVFENFKFENKKYD